MVSLFVSDIHLCTARPQKFDLFIKLLREGAKKAEAFYILGDLFDDWIGDDVRSSYKQIIAELAAYTSAGGRLFIMRGNRDFLINQKFIRQTGGQLLDDETVINLYGENTLLMHGDLLCTLDRMYQLFRLIVNNSLFKKFFMYIPYNTRFKIFHNLMNQTKKQVASKPLAIMDSHQPTVERIMSKYQTLCLIHGHTHRQAIHEFTLDGRAAKRVVLGDWIEKDSVLVADEKGLKLFRVAEYIESG